MPMPVLLYSSTWVFIQKTFVKKLFICCCFRQNKSALEGRFVNKRFLLPGAIDRRVSGEGVGAVASAFPVDTARVIPFGDDEFEFDRFADIPGHDDFPTVIPASANRAGEVPVAEVADHIDGLAGDSVLAADLGGVINRSASLKSSYARRRR